MVEFGCEGGGGLGFQSLGLGRMESLEGVVEGRLVGLGETGFFQVELGEKVCEDTFFLKFINESVLIKIRVFRVFLEG